MLWTDAAAVLLFGETNEVNMKIAIIGASGRQGSLLVKEALKRGADVTAVVRDATRIKVSGAAVLQKDIFDLTTADITPFDVVVSAFGTWEDMSLHVRAMRHLCDILKGHEDIRFLVVGGAGSLYLDADHGRRLMDAPNFPAEYLPVARGMSDALDYLRKSEGVNWVYLSTAAEFVPDGPLTGKYRIGGETFMTDAEGKSRISYADYAMAMIDEAEQGKHAKERISVIGLA